MVGQVNNKYAVNSDNLKEYAERINLLASQFQYFALGKVDWNSNKVKDRLAKIVSGETPNDLRILIELLSTPKHIHPLQLATSDFPT